MKKKVLSAVLALALVFGSAAALPQGFITESTSISVSAETYGAYEYKILSDGTAQITKCTSSAKSLVIPSSISGKTVTSVASGAFSMNHTLESITFPDSVTSIGDSAFLYCSQLSVVKFGKNLKTIGKTAFSQCRSLTSISIPANVTQIGESSFSECIGLKTVTIASGETATVDNYAFRGCTALTTVDLGFTVSAIGTSAFEGCKALTSITIPGSVNSINQAAFKNCKGLTKADLGNGVTTIANNAFINCSSLKSVKFGANLKTIGDSAFEDCVALTSITLMPNTKEVGISAFAGCSGMTTAVLTGVEVIKPKAFSYCSKLSEVNFCEKARAIGEEAFLSCGNLAKVYLPDSLNEIHEHSFGYGYNSETKTYGKRKNFTICGVKNTEAYQYAGTNKFAFAEVSSSHNCSFRTVTVPATCSAAGYTLSLCRYCGRTKQSSPVKAKGHSGSVWKTTAYNTNAKTSTQIGKCTVCGAVVSKTTSNAISRLAGNNRYTTAVDISKAEYPSKSNTVILANSMSYADALAGVPLAKKLDAPILLTSRDILDANTLAEIKRLGAKNVYILGGEGAVSKKVVAALNNNGITNIKRIAGGTRYSTATAIAKQLNSAPAEVFFVYGNNFADALSVGAVAAKKGAPVIYLNTSGAMNADTAKYLNTIVGKVKKAYIIGGTGVISDAMKNNVALSLLLADSSVIRVAGRNRYETCTAVNTRFSSTLSVSGICVAKGLDFPDALAGGVYAAKTAQPLFLADGSSLQACQKTYLKDKNPAKITAIGGKGAVSDALIGVIAKASI